MWTTAKRPEGSVEPRLHLSIDWRLRHLTGRHPIVVGKDVSRILLTPVLRRRVLSLRSERSELLHDVHYTVSKNYGIPEDTGIPSPYRRDSHLPSSV